LPKVKSIKPPPLVRRRNGSRFHLRDRDGQKLAYVYFEEEPGATLGGQAADAR
jgi:hypothetical protein